MKNSDEQGPLRFVPRPSAVVELSIPLDTLEMIRRVAEAREMSPEALLKFYIGPALRRDDERLFPDQPLPRPSFVPEGTQTRAAS